MSEIVKQSNYITNARYSFSDYEIKVLIYVIKDIQRILSSGTPEIQKNLLGEIDHKVYFTLSAIDVDNQRRIKTALNTLLTKTIEIDDENGWTMVNFISRARFIKAAQKYEIKIDECLMPYMVSLAKGFTTYQLETTLLLNANAKRLYFLFSEFANTGIFRINADKLKINLGLGESYKEYRSFKMRVLKSSIEEINALYDQEKCDLMAELVSDKKEKHQDEWDRTIEFRIMSKKKKSSVPIPHETKVEYYTDLAGMLSAIYKSDFTLGEKILSYFEKRADLPRFHKRVDELCAEKENAGQSPSVLAGLVRTIARQDYGFEANFKEKKEQKEINIAATLAQKFSQK